MLNILYRNRKFTLQLPRGAFLASLRIMQSPKILSPIQSNLEEGSKKPPEVKYCLHVNTGVLQTINVVTRMLIWNQIALLFWQYIIGRVEMSVERIWYTHVKCCYFFCSRMTRGAMVYRALMNFVPILRSVVEWLLNVRVLRGAGGGMSNHLLILRKIESGAGVEG